MNRSASAYGTSRYSSPRAAAASAVGCRSSSRMGHPCWCCRRRPTGGSSACTGTTSGSTVQRSRRTGFTRSKSSREPPHAPASTAAWPGLRAPHNLAHHVCPRGPRGDHNWHLAHGMFIVDMPAPPGNLRQATAPRLPGQSTATLDAATGPYGVSVLCEPCGASESCDAHAVHTPR